MQCMYHRAPLHMHFQLYRQAPMTTTIITTVPALYLTQMLKSTQELRIKQTNKKKIEKEKERPFSLLLLR